jgi:hypothetical protein
MSRELSGTIERLLEALRLTTRAQLAAALEIRPQSIVSALNRREIPEAWLYRVAYLTGRNVEWLRTGRGAVWREEVAADSGAPDYGKSAGRTSGRGPRRAGRMPASLRRLLQAWEELGQSEQATVARLIEALRGGDREIRDHLVREMKLIEDSLRARLKARARRRSRSRPGISGG